MFSASGCHDYETLEPEQGLWPGLIVRDGLFELRIDWGPGYRVYYAVVGRSCVLLICGGDKRKQTSDIKRALEYLTDYRRRTR